MKQIFISYRREETSGEARSLLMDIETILGKGSAFMDVDSISLGRDFRMVLQESLASCDMMIVLIGKDWLSSKNEAGQVRLENPDDFVRLEVGTALRRDIPVTPVLVHGARMPSADQLPEDLKDLSYRNGYELSHNRWRSDVQEMIKRLELRPADGPTSSRIDDPVSATLPPKGRLINKRLLAVAGACVFAIGVAGWAFVSNDVGRIEPSHENVSSGTVPLFFSCRTQGDCVSGAACVNYPGDKKYYCKPYCTDDDFCTRVFNGAKCLPLKDLPHQRICNDDESSLHP